MISRIFVQADRVEEAVEAITANIEASHREEGVLQMALHREVGQPDHLVVIETFRSAEEFDAHMETPHLKAAVEALGPLVARAGEVIRLEAVPVGDPRKGRLVEGA
jgi:quinol monooxygenase YgiN